MRLFSCSLYVMWIVSNNSTLFFESNNIFIAVRSFNYNLRAEKEKKITKKPTTGKQNKQTKRVYKNEKKKTKTSVTGRKTHGGLSVFSNAMQWQCNKTGNSDLNYFLFINCNSQWNMDNMQKCGLSGSVRSNNLIWISNK